MKTRQLLDKLFESDAVDPDVARQAIRYFISKGHDLETAKELAFKHELPKPRPAKPTDHVARLRAAANRYEGTRSSGVVNAILGLKEADFHSPEERAQLDAASKPNRMDKLRRRRPDLYPPKDSTGKPLRAP